MVKANPERVDRISTLYTDTAPKKQDGTSAEGYR